VDISHAMATLAGEGAVERCTRLNWGMTLTIGRFRARSGPAAGLSLALRNGVGSRSVVAVLSWACRSSIRFWQ